jgi:predicted dehydrogenase
VQRLRAVVIGVGAGVFSMHRPALLAQAPELELVAVSDVNTQVGRERAAEIGCPFFADHRTLLAEARPDLAVILAPHPFHAPIALDCFAAGCHVLVEKPIAVQVADADAMIEAAQQAGRLLAVNFQHRHRPDIRAARRLIDAGRLGQLQRVELVAIWTRTASYYELAAWRGTWAGEGGGILMNQAPHHLDLLCHLVGAPSRVVAWTRTLLHHIETEDTVVGLVEWPSGALGTLHLSTAEAGEPERIQIAGTRGILTIGQGDPALSEADTDLTTFIAESPNPFGKPTMRRVPVELEPGGGDHAAIYRNVLAAIHGAEPLLVDGVAARQSLELANALMYSGRTGEPVDFPLDRGAYANMLEDVRSRSTVAV